MPSELAMRAAKTISNLEWALNSRCVLVDPISRIIDTEIAPLRAENELLRNSFDPEWIQIVDDNAALRQQVAELESTNKLLTTLRESEVKILQHQKAELEKQVAELERQVAKLREDSERYNFIRDQTVVDDAKFVGLMCNVSPDTMSIAFAWDKEQSLDAAIDAALKGDEP